MGKKVSEKKYPLTNTLSFKREDYIRQPRSILNFQYRMDIIQLRAFACLMERLEPFIIELLNIYNKKRDNKELSIFDLPQAQQYIRKGLFKVNIPMKDLGIKPGFYYRAKESLNAITTIPVFLSFNENGKKKNLTGPAFYVETNAEDDAKYVKEFKIGMIQDVLDTIVDIRLGYNDYLKRIAFVTGNVNTVRLYILAMSNTIRSKKNSFNISLEYFREYFGLYNEVDGERIPKYKRYADLNKRVITPATEELKELADRGNSDFWVKVERVGIGRAGNPNEFNISVYYTKLSDNQVQIKERKKEDIELEDYLKSALKQTATNIRKIKARLLPEQRSDFIKETQRIAELLEKRNDIENQCSFVWVLLKNWLDNNEIKVEEIKNEPTQLEIFSDDNKEEVQEFPEISMEDSERWEKFIVEIKGRVGEAAFNTWFSCIKFISFSDNILTISAPTAFVVKFIEERHLDDIQFIVKEFYGEEVALDYKIEKL